MSAPVYSISLQVQSTQDTQFVAERSNGYRLRMTANVVSGFRDPGVFVLQKISAQESQFTCVASVTQMYELYVGEADAQTGFFRSAVLDLVFPDPITANETLEDIRTEIGRLCHEMSRTDRTVSQQAQTLVISSEDPLS